MRPVTRRELFKGVAGASASGALAMGAGRPAWAVPPVGRTRPSHLKLSLAAYSFRDRLTGKAPGKMDLFDVIDLAADNGLDGVELTSYYFPPDAGASYCHRLRRHAFRLGLDVSGTSVGNDFCLPDGPERDRQLALVRAWVDRAAELDAPVIRIFAGKVPKGDDEAKAVTRAVEGIRQVLPYAEDKGVTLALENHGGVTATPAQLLAIVERVDAPNFGVNLDTGNFHGDDPYADLAAVAPYAVNVQVKTEVTPRGRKTEEADLARVVDVLRAARYSGYVALEYEAAEDPTKAVPRYLKALRGLIG